MIRLMIQVPLYALRKFFAIRSRYLLSLARILLHLIADLTARYQFRAERPYVSSGGILSSS